MRYDDPIAVRHHERITKKFPVILVVKNAGYEHSQRASTVDLSNGGLRVMSFAPLNQGQIVYSLIGSAQRPLGLCRTVWVAPLEGGPGCVAGLQFLETKATSKGRPN